jgi:chitinase
MAANPTSRATFARNCRDLVEDYDFDGIDLDWEYPGYAAHSGTSADKANFNLLLQDVKRELDDLGTVTGRSYGLTAALPCGPSNINNIDIQTVSQYLTEFNLMSYDFHGSWDTLTGTNSPLYDQSNDPEHGWSVDGCVKNWVNRGAPKERLNIGLAFYGRSFRVAKGLAESHGGADDTNWEVDEGTPQYFNIMEKINSMTIEWDDETKTPIAYFPEGGLISYDDEQSICLKTEYALAEDLNGFIIWELSGDVMDDLNTPLLDILNRKLSEPDTNCADPFGPKLESLTATASVNAGEVSDAAVILPAPTPLATVEAPQASMIVPAQAPSTMAESPGGTTMDLTESEPEPPNATNDSTFSISAVADDPPTFATLAEEEPAETTSTSFTATVAQASASQPSAFEAFTMRTFDHAGRKKVQRENKKPNKPYRPPPKEL